MLLKEIVEKKRARFIERAGGWEDAIRQSCQTMVDDGTIGEAYADEIIAAVHELGPYIVLMPGFALPHSMKNSANANGTGISFMKIAEPVSFDDSRPEKSAQVFFTLAAKDDEGHLKNMRRLWKMLTDEALCADLLRVESIEGLLELDEKYS
jgi:PTS system ascorbate-specific IIA component